MSGLALRKTTEMPEGPPPAPTVCFYHRDTKPAWVCVSCNHVFCASCVNVRRLGQITACTCPICGGKCESVSWTGTASQADPDNPEGKGRKRSFYRNVPRSFLYPFKGTGLLLLAFGALFIWAMSMFRGSLMSWVGAGGAGGYMAAYMFKIIRETEGEDDHMPGWPEITNWKYDIAWPAGTMILAHLISFLPGLLCLAAGLYFGVPHPLFSVPLFFLGLFYLPMALLVCAQLDSYCGVSPKYVLPMIGRIPFTYLMACGFLLSVSLLGGLVSSPLMLIPYVGGWLATFVSFYFMVVQVRIIGLLYYAYEDRLQLFDRIGL